MTNFEGVGIVPADLLLPAAQVDPSAWACIACDQYTSEPEYWHEAAAQVGEKPSCLKLVLPECYLPETESRVPVINAEMHKYLAEGTLTQQVTGGFVLVERTTESGSRLGLVCAADLEQYDYTGVKCLIRPTEQTITSRLPARQAIRRGAALESSHIMLLMDDPLRTVIEPLYARRAQLPLLYDFQLMQGCGRLRGWAVTEESDLAALHAALTALKEKLGAEPLLFAVGDGNHSLATAKAHWNELKQGLTPAQQLCHPARQAMVEVVNIHDEALKFEPIHRVVTNLPPALLEEGRLLADWKKYAAAHRLPGAGAQSFTLIEEGRESAVTLQEPSGPIPAATLQSWLDDLLARCPEAEIDYIHGDEVVRRLAAAPGAAGFLLPPLDKSTFFDAIQALGILPRKTFSMGHAHEKRCYMECRAIR